MPDVIIVPSQPGYDYEFRSRIGMVARDLMQRSARVERAAQRDVGVRYGHLKRNIGSEWVGAPGGDRLTRRVGARESYALMHHQGTRAHVITPRNVSLLRFRNKRGQIVFAKSVNHPGTKPNPYLEANLHLAVQ